MLEYKFKYCYKAVTICKITLNENKVFRHVLIHDSTFDVSKFNQFVFELWFFSTDCTINECLYDNQTVDFTEIGMFHLIESQNWKKK